MDVFESGCPSQNKGKIKPATYGYTIIHMDIILLVVAWKKVYFWWAVQQFTGVNLYEGEVQDYNN